ncbi:MAG: beta-class carbonic anhydrase, partial [Candidatus Acidiferrum sp.]
RHLAVLTCMDTRLSILTLGLKAADAHIIRNAGGIVTDDALRSLIVSHYLLDTQEFMIINHTDCGLTHTSEEDLRNTIQNRTGTAAVAPSFFYAFKNIDENVRHQLQKLRTHPWVPKEVIVRGFVYDVTTGRLREIGDA